MESVIVSLIDFIFAQRPSPSDHQWRLYDDPLMERTLNTADHHQLLTGAWSTLNPCPVFVPSADSNSNADWKRVTAVSQRGVKTGTHPNQDRAAVALQMKLRPNPDWPVAQKNMDVILDLFSVFDGHGISPAAGHVCSSFCAEIVADLFRALFTAVGERDEVSKLLHAGDAPMELIELRLQTVLAELPYWLDRAWCHYLDTYRARFLTPPSSFVGRWSLRGWTRHSSDDDGNGTKPSSSDDDKWYQSLLTVGTTMTTIVSWPARQRLFVCQIGDSPAFLYTMSEQKSVVALVDEDAHHVDCPTEISRLFAYIESKPELSADYLSAIVTLPSDTPEWRLSDFMFRYRSDQVPDAELPVVNVCEWHTGSPVEREVTAPSELSRIWRLLTCTGDTLAELPRHPGRYRLLNVHSLSRDIGSIGLRESHHKSKVPVKPLLSLVPRVTVRSVPKGHSSLLLLCSDGIHTLFHEFCAQQKKDDKDDNVNLEEWLHARMLLLLRKTDESASLERSESDWTIEANEALYRLFLPTLTVADGPRGQRMLPYDDVILLLARLG